MPAPKEPEKQPDLTAPQLYRRRETLKKRRIRINAEIDAEMDEINAKLKAELETNQ